MHLPKRIFFTGVPGSRWSGIAQVLEERLGLNTSDRIPDREYLSDKYSGHKGSYFGAGMEFPALFGYIDQAHTVQSGCKLIKSHEWAFKLDEIKEHFPEDGIFMVYRDNKASFDWWKEAGGFNISYPSYIAYKNDENMQLQIKLQNESILDFCDYHGIKMESFDCYWMYKTFGIHCDDMNDRFAQWDDCFVAYIGPTYDRD